MMQERATRPIGQTNMMHDARAGAYTAVVHAPDTTVANALSLRSPAAMAAACACTPVAGGQLAAAAAGFGPCTCTFRGVGPSFSLAGACTGCCCSGKTLRLSFAIPVVEMDVAAVRVRGQHGAELRRGAAWWTLYTSQICRLYIGKLIPAIIYGCNATFCTY